MDLSAGQIVADKYRIDSIMGSGGMGVVVAATHVELQQKVAIKFLREVSPEALARFQREARMIVRLKSPHVARVFDVGNLEDDTPYIVMEHLDGNDLATLLLSRGRLPYEEAVDYVLQASEAVAEAHALGMVHRDLKPANLFLEKGPGGKTTVKVLDFGVSKTLDIRIDIETTRGGDLTNEGVALGSPGYMSPEQMTSARDVDARSDIFSLGAMLYRLLSGAPPYRGNSVVSILAMMATQPFTPLRSLVPEVPEDLALAIERCLVQDREGRWPNLALFAQALLPYASRRGRLSIEQISNTLGVPLADDALHDTRVRAPSTVPLGSSFGPMPPAAQLNPLGVATATVRMADDNVVTRTFTPVAAIPNRPHVAAPQTVSRALLIAVTATLTLITGVAMWQILRPGAPPVATEPGPGVAPPIAAAPSTVPAAASALVPPPATETAAPTPTTSLAASGAPAESAKTATKPGPRWRHPAGPSHPSTAAPPPNDPSKPPNPSDVPEGRH